MPFFPYQAQDPSGKSVRGSIQAESMPAAQAALQARGFSAVTFPGAAARPGVRVGTAPAMADPLSASGSPVSLAASGAIGSGPIGSGAAPVVGNAPTAPLQRAGPKFTHRDQRKDTYFLFQQLAAAFEAGISPAQAFMDIGRRSKPRYQESFAEIGAAATEGRDLAAVMARYPHLFTADAIGLVRAGQHGGFLGEAFREIGRQAFEAHKFQRFFGWAWFVGFNLLFLAPMVMLARSALLTSWKQIDATGGAISFSEAVGLNLAIIRGYFLWPIGPICLLILAIACGIRLWFRHESSLRLRHQLSLKLPVIGPRSREEGYARLAWTLQRLMRAGVIPARALAMALETVPNVAMREEWAQVAQSMRENEGFSAVFARMPKLPHDFSAVLATAEYTGDLPRAFEQLARSSDAEYQAKTSYARFRTGLFGVFMVVIAGLLAVGGWYYTWYIELPKEILSGFEP
ncbi:MAG: type II secretion system F family protein [Fimbriimonadaceae bacterium]|nr:type II secretion system F family protein [Fimbriimonadaceae bacterium]